MAVVLGNIANILGVSPAVLENCCDSSNVNKYGLGSACPGADADAKLANLQADQILGYFEGYDHNASGGIAIGNYYQGGIIVYIDTSGQHGIIAAESRSYLPWSPSAGTTGAIWSGLYSGDENTAIITSYFGAGSYAAKYCEDFTADGYSDWFLPSEDQIALCYQYRNYLPWQTGLFWSSTEIDSTMAKLVDFTNHSQTTGWKVVGSYALPCRYF